MLAEKKKGIAVRLTELLKCIKPEEVRGALELEVVAIQFDSRKVARGTLFVATPGTQVDGHDYIERAVRSGAIAVLCERLPSMIETGVSYVRVKNSRTCLGFLAQQFHGRPADHLKVVGVTGTNGKTTTATTLYNTFTQLGFKAGLLSTIKNIVGSDTVPATHTTGDALQIAELMASMVRSGCSHCFMEVTSHAIDQYRIAGIEFCGGIFTNLTHDHLDYHKTIEAYRDTKAKFFAELGLSAFALSNADDACGEYMVRGTCAQRYYYGKTAEDFRLGIDHLGPSGSMISINDKKIKTQLVGEFNAYNVCAVFGAAFLLGVDGNDLADVLAKIHPVSGRMERIDGPDGIVGVVDFAHTPDALRKVISTVREFIGCGRLITVMGCGGDRDQVKRPLMGEIAATTSDFVVITSDNPRSEVPQKIIADILAGIGQQEQKHVRVEPDRRAAIGMACVEAQSGDLILVVGKGHEKYQEIAGRREPFDDVETLQAALNSRGQPPTVNA